MANQLQPMERRPGMPKGPEVPGGSPQASRPASVVNPPAPASGPVGRPSLPPPAFPGRTRELPSVRPAGPAASSAPRPSPGASAPNQAQRFSGAQLPGGAPAGAMRKTFDRVPSSADLTDIPEGVEVETPYGIMDREGNHKFTPEGEVRYKQDMVRRTKEYGPHPFAGDPNAPKPPARLGRVMFNPFSGQWVK